MKYLLYSLIVIGSALLFTFCNKEDTAISANSNQNASPASVCLTPVRWGDTLDVVVVATGVFNGQRYWQATLSSKNRIEPSKFQNEPWRHRVTIADTIEITKDSKFHVSRLQ